MFKIKIISLIFMSVATIVAASSPVLAEFSTALSDVTHDDTVDLDALPTDETTKITAADTLDFDQELCGAEVKTTYLRRQPNNIVSNCDQKNRVRCLTTYHVVKFYCRCNQFCEGNDSELFDAGGKIKCSWSNELGCYLALRPDQFDKANKICDREMTESCKEKKLLSIPFNNQQREE